MISLSCFACTKGLHRVVKSAINHDTGNFHSPNCFTRGVSKSGGSSCGLMGSTRIIYDEGLDYLTSRFEIDRLITYHNVSLSTNKNRLRSKESVQLNSRSTRREEQEQQEWPLLLHLPMSTNALNGLVLAMFNIATQS